MTDSKLGSLRYERDLREHGAAVYTKPWWDVPSTVTEARIAALRFLSRPPENEMRKPILPDPWPFK
jgi:hypothetical protein